MPSKSMRKGSGFEREIVNQSLESGLEAKRAWGSNGRSLGLDEEVDLVVEDYKVQAKRRKSIASYLTPSDHVDLVVAREDGAVALAIMTWWNWLNMIKELKNLQERVAQLEKRKSVAPRADRKDKDSGTPGADRGSDQHGHPPSGDVHPGHPDDNEVA